MKAKSFLAAVIVLVSAAAFANGPAPRVVVINQKNSGTFKVIYEGEKAGDVSMAILNKNGETIFKDVTKNVAGFIRPVNFSAMEPGEYTIEVVDANGKQTQKVDYARVTSVKNVHVAKISDQGKYLLAVANEGAEQINVRIFDGAHNLVYNESRTIHGNFGLVYNLKDVHGVPTFEVTDNTGAVRTIR